MRRSLFAAVFATTGFFLGWFVDLFPMGLTHAHWINLFWSVADGLGSFVADKLNPGASMLDGPAAAAVFYWPWIVAIVVFLALRFGLRSDRIGWRHPAALFLIASALIWIPYEPFDKALGVNDPTWLSYYLAGY
jgi:hypothetical protein